ncbi:MAG: LytTR family DNA-binding domain-containing protein [Bacteroidia bacterium]
MFQETAEPKITTLIIDDEFRSRASLRMVLEHNFPQIEVVAEAASVAEGISMAREHKPMLVFLDIMLPDGSAFDFLDILNDPQLKVVVISAFPEHSVRAFRYAVAHYLVKPIDIRDLRTAISRVSLPASPDASRTASTGHNIGESVALHSVDGFKLVQLPEIVYCEADSNYTIFHFVNGTTFMVASTLGYYEELFADKAFYRVHNKFLVNLQHIKGYHRGRGGWIEMANGKAVEVQLQETRQLPGKVKGYARGG